MRRSTVLAQFLLIMTVLFLAFARPADAALLLFDDRDLFLQAVAEQPWIEDDFNGLDDGYDANPIFRFMETSFEYSLASSSPVGLMVLGDLISTVLPKSEIQFESQSGEIVALGGDFGLTDYNGVTTPGVLQIGLPDGSTISRAIDGVASFVGIVGVGETISSLSIGAEANLQLVTATSIVVAATPAPGALALFCLLPVGLRGSRRRG
ncbi:MAG: hypothetical protein MK116_03930 [Phycisphaerales bacterium]|nr:hypothetical protein [Phycisphaerales bacterium]